MTIARNSMAQDRRKSRALRILNLEDSPLDAELMQSCLSEGGITCELVRVQTRADFAAALEKEGVDLILADYSLPGFDGLTALEMARKRRPEVPFILVSGALGEETAIETLKSGATDYVLKHRLQRLVPAVRRAMHEAEERRERERAEEALRRSEQRLRTLVEQIPAVTYIQQPLQSSDPKAVTYMSPQYETMLGYPRESEAMDEEHWFKTLHPEDRERVLTEEARTDETGEPFRVEYRVIAKDGRVVWVRDQATLVRDEEGRHLYWLGVQHDITDQKQAQQALRQSEERYRTFIRQSTEGIWRFELEAPFPADLPEEEQIERFYEHGYLAECNDAMARMYGFERAEEIVGARLEDLLPRSVPENVEYLGAFIRSGYRLTDAESREVDREGNLKHFLNNLTGVVEDGYLVRAWGTQRDVTERKSFEEELTESEERFRATFEQAAVGMAHVSLDGRWLRLNRKLLEIVGYSEEELLRMTFQQITHPDDLQTDLEQVSRLLGGEIETYSMEKRYIKKDHSIVWINLTVSLVRDESGAPRYFIAVIEDIFERKEAREALRQSEELYRTVVEQAAENIFIIDPATRRILEANTAVHRSLGYAPDELKRMTLYDVDANDHESINNIQQILTQKRSFIGERKYRRKDGSLVDFEVNASVIPYGGKEAMSIVAHDVSERKQAEQELRRSLSVLIALREAGEVLSSTLESDEIVTRLLEIMRGVAALTTTIIGRRDEEGNLRVWRSVGLEALWPRVRFAPEAEKARWAALEHQEEHLLWLRHPDIRDKSLVALFLPLKVKDQVVGVLEAYGSEALAQNDTIEVLVSLTNQAASALENAQLYEELGDREHALQDFLEKLLRAQEEERRRVAYEVHDELAQVASAAHQHLQAFARRYPPSAESGRRDLERILRLVRGTVSDARRIIANLRPTVLDDLGLATALSLEVERLREEGYQVDYEEDLGEERLPATAEIALFRVVQEALTNVRKHAHTQQVRIELRHQEDEVRLEVQDYGRGFDPTAQPLESGPGERVGLTGMQERVNALGGAFEIHSRAGAGTSVVATVSLRRAAR